MLILLIRPWSHPRQLQEAVRETELIDRCSGVLVMVSTKLMTADDLLAMGSDAPYELIDGELVELSPTSFDSSSVTVRITILVGQ